MPMLGRPWQLCTMFGLWTRTLLLLVTPTLAFVVGLFIALNPTWLGCTI